MRRAEGVRGGLIEARYGAAMDRALTLAAGAGRAGEVPVGAVVLGPDGEALAEAANARQAACDPTAHAEVLAAIQLARLVRVVFAVWEPKTGACGSVRDVLRDPRANHRVEVVAGVRERESEALLRRFFAERR